MSDYPWKRFWSPRGGVILLTDRGYLADPDIGRPYSNPHLVSFETIAEDPCLILLGEPGIGKSNALATHVLETQQRGGAEVRCLHFDLRAYGSEQRLQRALFDHSEIVSWQGDTSVLHLFLDSLDESLLRVDTVTDMLVEEFERWPRHRLFLRIACRTADWRPTFEERLRHIWGHDAVGVFELAPLRRIDVSVAAQVEVRDPEAFLQEVDRVAAVPFAIKPVTLTLLLNTYRHQGTLPSRQYEVYERGCRLLCEETNPRRQEAGLTGRFTPEERLRAAERIAAITIFSNRYAVWTDVDWGDVPDSDITISSCVDKDAPEDRFIMPALKEALATGLFTATGPQELSWSHRTYAEFLAARFVTRTMTVEQILTLIRSLDDSQGKLIPQLCETAAWIASMNVTAFQAIMHIEPDALLKSDVIRADVQKRAALVNALLDYYEVEGAHDDSLYEDNSFARLAHPGLATQLEPYLLNKTRSQFVREAAMNIALACQERGLLDVLVRIALDETEQHSIRANAAAIVNKLGDDSVKGRLKPLLVQRHDPLDELKGQALKALWPHLLTISQLFAVLTPPQQRLPHTYDQFISSCVIEHLQLKDLPAALAWAREHALEQFSAFGILIDQIILLSWQYIDMPGIVQGIAEVARQRLEHLDGLLSGAVDAAVPKEGRLPQSFMRQYMREDTPNRLRILEALLPLWRGDSSSLKTVVSSRTPFVYEEDMAWLLERLRHETDEKTQQQFVQIIGWVFKESNEEHVESILHASRVQPLLARQFRWLLEPVNLHSKEAQEQKQTFWAQPQQREEFSGRDPLGTGSATVIQQLLDRFETGDLDSWWQLNRVLTFKPGSVHFIDDLAADITTLPGWREADVLTRERIIKAAKHAISALAPAAHYALPDRIHTWMGQQITAYPPLFAGYRAFFLLQREAPEELRSIVPEVWRQWAPMLASYPLKREEAAMEYHNLLIHMASQYAPAEIIATCLAQIDQQNREMSRLNCLHLVEACWNIQLERNLLDKVADASLHNSCLQELLMTLLEHHVTPARALAEMLLGEACIAGDHARATMLAGVLIYYTDDACWTTIWPLMQDVAFSKALLLTLQGIGENPNKFLQHLEPVQMADLYLRAVEVFSLSEDSSVWSDPASERHLISSWIHSILIALYQAGTREGCEALRKIAQAYPSLEQVRWYVIESERWLRQGAWYGFTPQTIIALAKDQQNRFVQNGEQLLDVVMESLVRLQETLHGETPARIFLWNDPAGDEGQKRYRPKDENSLSDYVKLHLERDLKQRGIIVLREVEIRRAVGGDPGERTDLYVDAYVPGPNHTKIDILTVIIEVKGCWHRKVETAMQTQLVERYLRDNPCRHGLYLIGWFNCPRWDPTDHRKNDAPQINLEEARAQYAQQAEALTAQSADGRLVKSFVLDTALR